MTRAGAAASPCPHGRQRMRASGADHQDLVDTHPSVAERHRPTDEIEPPDAHDLLTHELGEPVEVGLEVLQPVGHGAHVVLPHRVHVAYFETSLLEVRH